MNVKSSLIRISTVLANFSRQYCKLKKNNLYKLLLSMPRDTKHIEEAQKQRIKIKERSTRYTPGTVNIQVLGSGAPGSPSSVYVFTDHSRYLFNCGEGTQRLAHEHRAKLARLEHIFITRTSWQQIGGLPGLSLTVQDAGVPNLTLHGPSGLDEIYRAMQKFVVLRNLKVNAPLCQDGEYYDDQVMTVKYIHLTKNIDDDLDSKYKKDDHKQDSPPALDETDYFAHESKRARKRRMTRQRRRFNQLIELWCRQGIDADEIQNRIEFIQFHQLDGRNAMKDFRPPMDIENIRPIDSTVMCYICKLKPRPGALCLEKCVEKGVPPGPLLGQLKSGVDVTLSDGTVIKSSEVRAPDDPGPIFIIIDIPSFEYLESLKSSEKSFEPYQATTTDGNFTALVIHFTPTEILYSDKYQEFIRKFSDSTHHLVVNDCNSFSGYYASHKVQWQLNQLNEYVFPLLRETTTPQTNSNHLLRLAPCLTLYHLRPRRGVCYAQVPSYSPNDYLQESNQIPGFKESIADVKVIMAEYYKKHLDQRDTDYPKIVFLGTGSCIPNKTRNVSSILVHTTANSAVLLDCGEGTAGQLHRFYGPEEIRNVYHKIKAIYVSHLHADHHIGLIGLLQERAKYLGDMLEPVMLLAPKQISSWLYFYDKRIESIRNTYELIYNADLVEHFIEDRRANDIGLRKISTCLVRHCPHSFGIALEFQKLDDRYRKQTPIKITYSGDTMPCDSLIELGRDSTILIHEATMEDELAYEARLKMHSTISQALDQASRMNASFTMLTHFSQRYAKIPRLEKGTLNNRVFIAFDNMEVTLTDLDCLHHLYPSMKILFSEHFEEMEQKAQKRANKRQRLSSNQDIAQSVIQDENASVK